MEGGSLTPAFPYLWESARGCRATEEHTQRPHLMTLETSPFWNQSVERDPRTEEVQGHEDAQRGAWQAKQSGSTSYQGALSLFGESPAILLVLDGQ